MSANKMYDCPEMADLIKKAQQGSEEAFAEIYKRYRQMVFAVCMKLTANSAVAEECAQETFLSVWRHIKNFRGDAKFSTWITRIATNAALMRHRKERKHQRDVSLEEARHYHTWGGGDPDLFGEDIGNEPPAGELSHDAGLASRMMDGEVAAEQVGAELQKLPAIFRTVICLKISGMSGDEMATVLGCSLTALKSRILRGKRLLRLRLEGNRLVPQT